MHVSDALETMNSFVLVCLVTGIFYYDNFNYEQDKIKEIVTEYKKLPKLLWFGQFLFG